MGYSLMPPLLPPPSPPGMNCFSRCRSSLLAALSPAQPCRYLKGGGDFRGQKGDRKTPPPPPRPTDPPVPPYPPPRPPQWTWPCWPHTSQWTAISNWAEPKRRGGVANVQLAPPPRLRLLGHVLGVSPVVAPPPSGQAPPSRVGEATPPLGVATALCPAQLQGRGGRG